MNFTFWEYIKLAVATIVGAGSLVGAISLIIGNSKRYIEWKERRRLATCPNREVALHSLGGQILLMCDRAIYKGTLPDEQRKWLIESFGIYSKAGGNGVVKYYYEIAMKLPPETEGSHHLGA